MSTTTADQAPPAGDSHLVTYPRFLWECVKISVDGGLLFYAWMFALTAMALVGANAWAQQLAQGMALTNLNDHVSWGLYIANFTFGVGLAAGAVMMVIPAYLYDDEEMHEVVIVGELLAIAAIIVCVAFVIVDMGRPDRLWHMAPIIGRFHWPMSMLAWDVVVLIGYLLLNLHISGYMIYSRFVGKPLNPKWYVPFVFLSVAWAISIHTVTAFLYTGLGSRPFWNDAIIAPRFIASAFVTGPAFLIVALTLIRRLMKLAIPDGPIRTLARILRVTVWVNLFLLGAEVFTQLYTGGSHAAAARYLYLGLDGHSALVPWIWSAIALNATAAVVLLLPVSRRRPGLVLLACVLTFVGVWIEKGMGMIVPGFVPSTLHEIVEYAPSPTEWKLTVGIWAVGLGVFTVAVKIAAQVLTGRSGLGPPRTREAG
ncbi:MAG: polysulfide reductase NrfD [Myxococcota bacterium]|nr:polysulfide reductase NrfD [Myxococcota bacterium]